MKILVAPDSFKGSLTAQEVCEAIKVGIENLKQRHEINCIPLADGGEGTAAILTSAIGGKIIDTTTTDPLGRTIEASYGWVDSHTAIIDMAAASGITLMSKGELDARHTSTYGTGLLIKDALNKGAKKIILGLGGSATNDGGTGMAAALGYQFLDEKGNQLPQGGIHLLQLDKIVSEKKAPEIGVCEFLIATDVTNPLLGKEGASLTFGPQKGATPEIAKDLDKALRKLSECLYRDLGKEVASFPGAGAAGGLGAGSLAFLEGEIRSGFSIVAEQTKLEEHITSSDLIITGEGMYDATSAKGKVVSGVLSLAEKYGKQAIILAGSSSIKSNEAIPIVTLTNESISSKTAISNAKKTLKERVAYIFKVVLPELKKT